MHLFDLVSKEKLHESVSGMAQESGLSVIILNPEGEILLQGHPPLATPHRCDLIGSQTPSCPKDHTETVSSFLKNPHPHVLHCHEGYYLHVSPLRIQNSLLGSLVVCQVHDPALPLDKKVPSLIERNLQGLLQKGAELGSLSQELVRNYEELALLHDLTGKLGAQPDLSAICRIVTNEVERIIPTSYLSILLINRETAEISPKVVRYHNKDYPASLVAKIGKGVTAESLRTCLEEGRLVILRDLTRHLLFPDLPFSFSSLLCAPMLMKDKPVGMIEVADKLSGEEFSSYDMKLLFAIATEAGAAIESAYLFKEVKTLFLSTVGSLVSAIGTKDDYTGEHSIRVARISSAISEEMGLSAEEIEDAHLAALLHDIGKIGTPDVILSKAGSLTTEEWSEMRKHPLHSFEILRKIKQFEKIAEWVKHEHERYDGKGYPEGLKGEEIPLASRIIAVADAVDAVTTDRVYRKGVSLREAITKLKKDSGTQFDPHVFDALLSCCHKGKVVIQEKGQGVEGEKSRHEIGDRHHHGRSRRDRAGDHR